MRMTIRMTLFLALGLLARQAEPVRVDYRVELADPKAEKYAISMTIAGAAGESVDVAIPAWMPGAYAIREFHKEISAVKARDESGAELAVSSVDDRTWRVKTGGAKTVTVSYEKSASRRNCLISGPAVYLYVVGHKEAPCRVQFKLPPGWRVGTGLESDGDGYKAPDYDTFIDCPTELGEFELLTFDQDGARYELVIHADGPVDGPKLTEMCRKIVKEQNAIFGGPPFTRFVFIYHFRGGSGGGGLEHLNSTNISMPYDAVKADPHAAASITSHEYFHVWNVKRIRPKELGPFDYTGIVRSKALWQCEGVTSYFGDRSLARCGLWTEERYFRHLADEIEVLQNNADRKVTTVEQASERTWDRRGYPRLDYYNKGELIGLLLDLKLRAASDGKKSYDDVMRLLYRTYVTGPSKEGQGPIGVGFPEDGLLRAINEVAGADWTAFYDRHIRGLEELPYAEVFAASGLALEMKEARSPDLGIPMRGSTVAQVTKDSEADKAGVKEGDRIVELNGAAVTRRNFRSELGKLKPGDEAKVKLQRGEDRIDVALKVVERERVTCGLRRAENLTDAQKRILDEWLGR
jgi:predicted metalloprotease with PDZ domain